jgi:hypothetical protein
MTGLPKKKRFGQHPHSRLPRNPLHCQPKRGSAKASRMRKARKISDSVNVVPFASYRFECDELPGCNVMFSVGSFYVDKAGVLVIWSWTADRDGDFILTNDCNCKGGCDNGQPNA